MKNEGCERRYGGNVVEVRMAWSVIVVVVVGSLYGDACRIGRVKQKQSGGCDAEQS
jgi:hypothetical protein